jgi:hypothetical protein
VTLQECTALLTPLVLALGAEMDQPTFRAYHRVLEDVPTNLLQAAVDHASRTARFFPRAPELRALAEQARRRLSDLQPFQACAQCASGWVEREVDGVPRMVRCACWQAHQQRLSQAGVSLTPLALPAGDEAEA